MNFRRQRVLGKIPHRRTWAVSSESDLASGPQNDWSFWRARFAVDNDAARTTTAAVATCACVGIAGVACAGVGRTGANLDSVAPLAPAPGMGSFSGYVKFQRNNADEPAQEERPA